MMLWRYHSAPILTTSGKIYVCLECQNEDRSHLRSLTVPRREADKYQIEYVKYICPKCLVEVRTGNINICPQCKQFQDNTKILKVPKSQNDQYRVVTVKKLCAQCQAESLRPGTWKHLPILIDVKRSVVLQKIGKPQDTSVLAGLGPIPIGPQPKTKPELGSIPNLISLEWEYGSDDEDKLKICFDQTQQEIRVQYLYYFPGNFNVITRDILSKDLIAQEPSKKYAGLDFFVHIWRTTSGAVMVRGKNSRPNYSKERYFDETDGLYKNHWRLTNAELTDKWLDCPLEKYEQNREENRLNKNLGLSEVFQEQGYTFYCDRWSP